MKQTQRLSNHKTDAHFLIWANKENKGKTQLLIEHLKLFIWSFMETIVPMLFFFFPFPHNTDMILGVLKERRCNDVLIKL